MTPDSEPKITAREEMPRTSPASDAPAVTGKNGTGAREPRKRSKDGSLQQDLDRLSLVQALADTEAATARVVELTERLVDSRQQNARLRSTTEHLRIELAQLRAEHEAMTNSRAYRLASQLRRVHAFIRG